MNYNLQLNLSKVKNTFVATITGKTASKKCVCIPIENLIVGGKGIYLDATVWENKEAKFGQTHSIKQAIDKETFEKMTDEEKKALPYIGSLSEFQQKKNEQVQEAPSVTISPDDDLPF